MATVHLPPDFKEFLQLLNSHQVEYLLIGAMQLVITVIHGPQPWIAIAPENAEKVVKVLQTFGFGAEEVTPDLFLKEEQSIRMGLPPVRIEI